MILANRWIEWAVRLCVYVALLAVTLISLGIKSWSLPTPIPWVALGAVVLGFLVLAVIEYRVRRHRCWAVTNGYDFDALRGFFSEDPAHRYLPLPSQRDAFEAKARQSSSLQSVAKPAAVKDSVTSEPSPTLPKTEPKSEPPPPPLPALAATPEKAAAPAPMPKPAAAPSPTPIAVSTPVPETPPTPPAAKKEAPPAPTPAVTVEKATAAVPNKPVPPPSPAPAFAAPKPALPAAVAAPPIAPQKELPPPSATLVVPEGKTDELPAKPVPIEKNGSATPAAREKTNATADDLPSFPS